MADAWTIGDRILDRWEVYQVLQGGMGLVYIVYDHELHEPCAIKAVREELLSSDPGLAERFVAEAYVWINLDAHPNITRALDVAYTKAKPRKLLLFLEYVSGGDLRRWIGTQRLTENPRQVLLFAMQFSDGMIHASSKGVRAHRDVKPANCLITRNATLKIADFGLAKLFNYENIGRPSAQLSSVKISNAGASALGGTPAYMAPEQFVSGEVDVKADVYSFGVMLFEMLTGMLPFMANSLDELVGLHIGAAPPLTKSKIKPLDDLVRDCLAKHSYQRPQDFCAIRQTLAGIYERVTGESPPPPASAKTLSVAELVDKGVSLTALRRHREAIICFDQCIAFTAYTSAKEGNALGQIYSALAQANKARALVGLGRHSDAVACCDAALPYLADHPPAGPRVWSTKAWALHHLGRGQDALDCVDRVLRLNPLDAEAWSNKGLLLGTLRRADEALRSFRKAISLDPQSEMAWNDLGKLLAELGRTSEAVACFHQAILIDPSDGGIWGNKGICLEKLGKLQEAKECFRLAAERGDAQAQYNLGLLYSHGRGVARNYTEALQWYTRAAEKGHAEAQLNLGYMYSEGRGIQQDFEQAVRLYRLAAEQGHATAQHNLGEMCSNGQGLKQDHQEAARWYRLAAEQGRAADQNILGSRCELGQGVPQDYGEAVKWFRRAAEQGHSFAQYNLGRMYERGRGVLQKDYEAVNWYQLAAQQGVAPAQYNLGVMHYEGRGTSQNYQRAIDWFLLAAKQGWVFAERNVGLMYARGQGVAQDHVQAYKWLNVAAVDGDIVAAKSRDELIAMMLPNQITEAQQAAKEHVAQRTNVS